MLVAEKIRKIYNNIPVLELDYLEIKKGETFGLVGNNGAGKTTFFRLILDLIQAEEGKILSKETDVKQSEHWKRYTSAHIDESFLIDFLSAGEYFDFIAKLRGVEKNELNEFLSQFDDFFDGEILSNKKYIRELSKGNKQKVGIVASFIGHPEIVILDEPFANLDPSSQFRLKNILSKFKDQHQVTLVISSHDLNHVTEVCNRIVVLDKGKKIHDIETNENTLEKLKEHFAVIAE